MQILIALVVGTAAGLVAHFTVGHRNTRGAALGPMIGAFVGGAVWLVLTWAGLGIDNPWIWLASAAAPFVVVYPALGFVSRARANRDTQERQRLRISGP